MDKVKQLFKDSGVDVRNIVFDSVKEPEPVVNYTIAFSIAGMLQGTLDAKGKITPFKVSASGYANVGGLKDGVILADFAPVLTVNKVKAVLAIKTNLWFDRSNDHGTGIGEARFAR